MANSQVLYRKYRPETLDEVVGQEHITKVIAREIAEKTFSHAYLFAGSRGLGKTSIARIFAREIGTSENDTHEIDAASNRGIDDIRELREAVRSLPFSSPYKVYIIDEVHMLTKEAFNALLKTLEEPPSHAIFILATTESEKLPETIISRCEVFKFKQPHKEVLKDYLIGVAAKEKRTLDPAGAELIALLGDGSFRDALGVLQKVLGSVADKKVTREHVENITGAPKAKLLDDIITSIAKRDPGTGLAAISHAAKENMDMSILLTLLVERIRAILILRHAPALKDELIDDFTPDDMELLSEHARSSKEVTSGSLHTLLGVFRELKRTPIPHLPLELAVIELTKPSESKE